MKRFIFLSAPIFRGEKHFSKAKNEALISKIYQCVRSEYIIVGFLRPQSLKITLLYFWWGRGPLVGRNATGFSVWGALKNL